MKKSELVKIISKATGATQADATRKLAEIDVIVEAVAKELEVEDKAKLGNYLVIEKKVQAARKVRNPKTGEEMEVAEKVVLKAKSTSKMKNL